jgi:hypothetical protein
MRFPRIRTLLLLTCALAFVFWLRYGEQLISGERQDRSAKIISEYQRQVEKKHPEAANWVEQQKAMHGERALAASIDSQRGVLADFETRQLLTANATRLVSVYQRDPDEAILWSHGTALQVAKDDFALADELLRRLETAQAQPQIWALIRDNPMALSSDLLFESQPHREFYSAHQAWIDDLMMALAQSVELETAVSFTAAASSMGVSPAAVDLDTVLDLAVKSHPHLKLAIPKPQSQPAESAVIFLTVLEHRDLIVAICNQGVPPLEAVEVLLLNGDFLHSDVLASDQSKHRIDSMAARLLRVHREKKTVWDHARREPLLLHFDHLVPLYSQRLIEKYPHHGIPALVVTQYSDAPVAAAAAIDRYGELAIAVLVHYADSPRFVDLLRRGDDGYQSVMVAAIDGDVGLEKLASDPRYLRKLIGEDGNPRQAEWWQSVPVVGGLANVARNYATDRPSDWSEIGWAAWDVGDAVLIVGSLGASKLLTEAGKQGIKATARGAGRTAALRAGTRSGTLAAGTAARAPTALQRLSRIAARGAGAEAVGLASRAAAFSTTLHLGGRVVLFAARPLVAVSGKAFQASRAVLAVSRGTPPLVRLWVTRGLLGISLLARTPAMVYSVATGVANFTASVVDQIGRQVDAIKELVGLPITAETMLGRGVQRITYFGGLLIFGLIIGRLLLLHIRPSPRFQ